MGSNLFPVPEVTAILPDRIIEVAKLISETTWLLSEEELLKGFPSTGKLYLIRDRFWSSFSKDGKVDFKSLHKGLISENMFSKYARRDKFLAFLLTPPLGYKEDLQGLLREKSISVYREILETGIKYIDSEGAERVDARLLSLKLNVIKQLEDRIMGKALENKKVDVSGLDSKRALESTSDDLATIEDKIKELEG